jgi:hypothetical protein
LSLQTRERETYYDSTFFFLLFPHYNNSISSSGEKEKKEMLHLVSGPIPAPDRPVPNPSLAIYILSNLPKGKA